MNWALFMASALKVIEFAIAQSAILELALVHKSALVRDLASDQLFALPLALHHCSFGLVLHSATHQAVSFKLALQDKVQDGRLAHKNHVASSLLGFSPLAFKCGPIAHHPLAFLQLAFVEGAFFNSVMFLGNVFPYEEILVVQPFAFSLTSAPPNLLTFKTKFVRYIRKNCALWKPYP